MTNGIPKLSRRQLLAGGATACIATALAPYLDFAKLFPAAQAVALNQFRAGYFKFVPSMIRTNYYSASEFNTKTIFEWNLETGRAESYAADTVIHVVETHPLDSNLSVLATKRTDQISMWDWRSKKEISKHRFAEAEYFYGHAVFTDDGRHLVTSTYRAGQPSRIVILEVPSLKIVDSVVVPLGIAHEMANIGNDRFLFGVGNSEVDPVAFGLFDFAKKSIRYFKTAFGAGKNSLAITHLKECGDRYIANVNTWGAKSALDGAMVSFNVRTHEVKTEIQMGDQGLRSEMLSFEFDPTTDFAWITLPTQNEIKVWNLKTDSLVKTLRFDSANSPTAVSYVPSLSLAIVTSARQFFAFDSNTLARREAFELKVPNSVLDGGFTAHSRLV